MAINNRQRRRGSFRGNSLGILIRVQGIESRCDDPEDLDAVLEQCRIIVAYVEAGNEALSSKAVRRLADLMRQRAR